MTNRILRSFSALALVLSVAGPLGAQSAPHPNTDRGFRADGVYQMGDIDNVNLFNGQLSLTIPIGTGLAMGGGSSYQLTLVYSGSVWDYRSRMNCPADPTQWAYVPHAFPAMHANAGNGWVLSLGRFISEDDPDFVLTMGQNDPYWDWEFGPPEAIYESPDGSKHQMFAKLHGNSPEDPLPAIDPQMGTIIKVLYSRDGSYLRYKEYTSGWVDVESPDGIIRRFDPTLELEEIRDLFGNVVYVRTYRLATAGDPISRIELEDKFGRITTIHYQQRLNDYKNLRNLIDRIEVPAFGGGTPATYTFYYTDMQFPLKATRDYCPGDVIVPQLTRLELPETEEGRDEFRFEYKDEAGQPAAAISKVVLPTGGAISWTFQDYLLPAEGNCQGSSWLERRRGVKERRLYDRDGTVLGLWTYAQDIGPYYDPENEEDANLWRCPDLRYGQTGLVYRPFRFFRNWVRTTVVAPGPEPGDSGESRGSKSVHYFSAWASKIENSPDTGSSWLEYGLPYARGTGIEDRSGRAISQQTFTPESAFTPVRSTYLKYELDFTEFFLEQFETHRRVQSQETVFHDDGNHYVTTANSDYDGFGNYRQSATTGSLAGGSRTVETKYNVNALGQASDTKGAIGSVPFFSPTDAWLPRLFTEKAVSDSAGKQRELFRFERATGFLEMRRILKDTSAAPVAAKDDVVFHYTRNASGELTQERQYLASNAGECSSGCNSQYITTHGYDHGVRNASQRPGATFKTLDLTIDSSTGLPSSSRDTAGVQTSFNYDSRGRVTSVVPTGAVTTTYDYHDETAANQASVDVMQTSGGLTLTQQRYEYDGFGRLTASETWAPTVEASSGEWVRSEIGYNALGAKIRVSEAFRKENPPATKPATVYSGFDAFGRPGLIVPPDGWGTALTYKGQRQTNRTTWVRTASTQEQSTTTEEYDNQGRLVRVLEPSGANGALVMTEYSYDSADRLTRVCQNLGSSCGQERQFVYDGRGFLTAEKHPESGWTLYSEYDSLGNARKRTKASGQWFPIDSLFNHEYVYDSFGRLIRSEGRNPYDMECDQTIEMCSPGQTGQPFRPIKELFYGNSGSANGKLESAVRHNWLPSAGHLTVTEAYQYGDAAGRLTDRRTTIRNETYDALYQVIDQHLDYDELGNVRREDMPSCDTPSGCGVARFEAIEREYTFGRLTAVDSLDALGTATPFAKEVLYHPNGVVASIKHQNDIVDSIALDSTGMARPASIAFSPYQPCSTPTITSQPLPQSVILNASASFSVSASGSDISYQWHSLRQGQETGDTKLSGANGASYVVPNAQHDDVMWATVTSTCGRSTPASKVAAAGTESIVDNVSGVETNRVELDVISCEPTITSQPQSLTIAPLTAFQLTVVVSGAGPYTYQWYEGPAGDTSEPLFGETFFSFGRSNLTQSAVYWVRATGACGSVDSSAAVVTVSNYDTPQLVQKASGGLVSGWFAATTWPAATQDGNHLFAFIVTSTSVTVTPPAGWQLVTSVGGLHMYVIEGSPSRSGNEYFSLSWQNAAAITLAEYSGLMPGGALDQFASASSSGTSASSGTTATTAQPAELVLTALAAWSPVTFSNPTNGFSQVHQHTVTGSGGYGHPTTAVHQLNVSEAGTWGHVASVDPSAFTLGVVTTWRAKQLPCSSPPLITMQPQYSIVEAGSAATVSVATSGSWLQYQWYEGVAPDTSVPMNGATESTFTTPALSTPATYWVRVWNDCGSVDSDSATVDVECIDPPTLTGQPAGASLIAGQTATLQMSATGVGLAYQWYEGVAPDTTRPVPGASSASFTTPPLAATTTYWARVTNGCGAVQTQTVTIDVCVPANVTQHPQSVSINEGTSAQLTAGAAGTGTLAFQWYEGVAPDTSRPVAGATAASMTTPVLVQSTSYWVRVTGSCGADDSVPAVVSVDCVNVPAITASPSSTTIFNDGHATLSVTAGGTGPLMYQWFEGVAPDTGSPVDGASGASFTTPALSSTSSYWVRVTNACGASDSATSTVTVLDCAGAPSITSQPGSTSIENGQTAILSVSVSGTGLTSYQWYQGSSPSTASAIPGATSASFTTPALTATTSYWVRISNDCGSADSATATVTVLDCSGAPSVTTQPESQSIWNGQSATLSVTASGTGARTYQWYQGAAPSTATPIAGATSTSYTTPALTSTKSYWVRVANDCGATDSQTATITVLDCSSAPTITTQPSSQTKWNGQAATLSVTAGGIGTKTYQWYQGAAPSTATPIAGATSNSYTTPALTSTKSYWVRVTNDCGVTNSQTATVTVLDCSGAPTITTQPSSQTRWNGQTATLSVTAGGIGTKTYQWYQGAAPSTATPVAGATSSSYTTPALTSTKSYWVRIVNACGATNSATATITVLDCGGPPSITTQPVSQSIISGQAVTLSVTAGGTGTKTYQWYQGASPSTATPIAGATSSSYTTPALASTKSYWVRVTNACGTANSQTATVTVLHYATPTRVQSYGSGGTWGNGLGWWRYPTQPGNLLLAFVTTSTNVTPPADWQLVANRMSVYLYAIENAPSRSGNEVFLFGNYGFGSVTLLEYSGIAPSGAFDKTFNAYWYQTAASTGYTPTTTQAHELVVTILWAWDAVTFTNPTNGFTDVSVGVVRQQGYNGAWGVYEKNVTSTGSWGHEATAVNYTRTGTGLVTTWRAALVP